MWSEVVSEAPAGQGKRLEVLASFVWLALAVAALLAPATCRSRQILIVLDYNGRYAVGSCFSYAEAQVMFHRWDRDGDGDLEYANSLTLLAAQKDKAGQRLGLIDDALAAARGKKGKPRWGHLYREMKTIGGKPIDWRKDFALCATPARYKYPGDRYRTGRHTFIVSTDGVVFGKDLGEARFVDDYPADPLKDGWKRAE